MYNRLYFEQKMRCNRLVYGYLDKYTVTKIHLKRGLNAPFLYPTIDDSRVVFFMSKYQLDIQMDIQNRQRKWCRDVAFNCGSTFYIRTHSMLPYRVTEQKAS